EAVGVPLARVECRIGDTQFPPATVSGGSRTAGSVGPAVRAAALKLRAKLDQLAGGMAWNDPAEILRRKNLPLIEAEATALTVAEATGKSQGQPPPPNQLPEEDRAAAERDRDANDDEEKYAFQSFGAHFVEVTVDPELGETRVRRVVSAMDVGRV